MKIESNVELYISKHLKFYALLKKLRNILLNSELEETIKWGAPAYTYNKKNLIGLAAFKNHVSLWFHQGALLKDEQCLLINAQEKTQLMRQMRFKDIHEIDETLVCEYIKESIGQAKSEVPKAPKIKKSLILPENLTSALANVPQAQAAFDALSLPKKRDFAEYIAEAKRETTITERLNKVLELLSKGQGLNDKYKR